MLTELKTGAEIRAEENEIHHLYISIFWNYIKTFLVHSRRAAAEVINPFTWIQTKNSAYIKFSTRWFLSLKAAPQMYVEVLIIVIIIIIFSLVLKYYLERGRGCDNT